jgi:hypothetical protein
MTSVAAIAICAATIGSASTPVDFDTQIMPILTQAGCNSGACHGAAAGRGGLHLSLYGSDPAADFATITQQWEGRRVNTARPERSLVLRKPLMDLDHGGDQRFDADSEAARLLLRWISEGAERHQQRRLKSIAVSPAATEMSQLNERLTLSVIAMFDDQTTTDVTRWAVVTAEDPASLRTTGEQALEVLRPGRHLALVRYLDRIEAVHVVLPYADRTLPPGTDARQNEIDNFILAQLQALGLECSPQADDATFLRRVSLHLTGRLPDPERVQSFLADTSATRRIDLIDELLNSPVFVDYWTFELGKLLRLRPIGNDEIAAMAYRDWISEQIQSRRPYDGIARTLLNATGDSHVIAAANFHRVISGPREQAEFVSELFLGVRLRCANCHDHPLDVWTQDDYHGLAAVFARLQRGQVVSDGERGEVTHPRTQEAALPRLPGSAFLSPGDDARARLADWVTADDNPFFARAIVNRVWKHLFGRGLVEPVDDLRQTNPGTHPELLQWLADDFVSHGYDLRHTLRRIAGSATYQRDSQPTPGNAIDDRFYSRYLPAPLQAEVLADAVADVTAVSFAYGSHPPGTRAVSLIDPKTPAPSLDVLGRCGRDGSCDEATSGGGVAVKLHLLNGPFLNTALTDEHGRLRQLLSSNATDAEIIDEFYLRALSRLPNDDERSFWEGEFEVAAEDHRQVAEDFLWSLLTSREFMTNH